MRDLTPFVNIVQDQRTAIAVVRSAADEIIAQAERRAQGWDRGAWRDDMPPAYRTTGNTIRRQNESRSALAFAVAERFAGGRS